MEGHAFPSATDPAVGRKLGKYEILARLSTGGMSEIFLAFQRGLGGFKKMVVLKQILQDIKGDEEFVRMFLDEARITGMFTHPNIAQVFDLDIQDGELFLAMEFVPGATLVEVARACRQASEPIPIGFTLMAVRDTALALHYAHTFTDPAGRQLTVIHRDIAEKNIMVTYEGVTKLLDFGIAKNMDWRTRTMVGMVKGTSGYMSPEQLTGQPLDARSDIFSLGVVFHECLTGMRLFPSKGGDEGMQTVLKEDAPHPSRQNKAVTPEIDAVVARALQRNRDERYATALEFARDVERAAGPIIWHAERAGMLIQRFFSDRRERTRELLDESSGEHNAEAQLADLLAKQYAPQSANASLPKLARPPAPGTRPTPTPNRTSSDRVPRGRANGPPVLSPASAPSDTSSGEFEPRTLVEAVPRLTSSEDDTLPPGPAPAIAGPAPLERVIGVDDSLATAPPLRAFQRSRTLPVVVGSILALGVVGLFVCLRAKSAKAPRAQPTAVVPQPPRPQPPPVPESPHPPPPTAVAVADGPKVTPVPVPPPPSPPLPVAHPSPPPTIDKGHPPVRPTRPRPRPKPLGEDSAEEPERPHKPGPGDPGQLSLTTDLKTKVQLQSQVLGETPFRNRSIPAGTHALKLTAEDGRAYRLVVDIKGGYPTSLQVSLSTLPPWTD